MRRVPRPQVRSHFSKGVLSVLCLLPQRPGKRTRWHAHRKSIASHAGAESGTGKTNVRAHERKHSCGGKAGENPRSGGGRRATKMGKGPREQHECNDRAGWIDREIYV